ncbi:MAG: hemerythrin family protein [Fibrobacteres bacterium]|jgi:hemerythrin|nr:hemerythrin family protein [Fibrobacterota bacterium]
MSLAAWDPKYATGNLAIDGQHKKLFQMVNELHDSLLAGAGREKMGPTLKGLATYTVEHFRTEEGFMTQKGYPGYPEHKRKHEELLVQVTQLITDFDAGKLTLPLTLARFLADWIRHHIDEEDQKLAKWIKSN